MFGLGRAKKQTQTTAIHADEQRSLADPTAFDFQIFGAPLSISGVPVTAATALRVPAVAAGVKAIAEAVSILPLHAYERGQDGSRERLADHPAYRLLNGDANPWTRGPQLRELLTSDAIAYGNGYAQIVRDAGGEPTELHRLHPPTATIEIDTRTQEPRYRVQEGQGQRIIAFADMIPTSALRLRSPRMPCADAPR